MSMMPDKIHIILGAVPATDAFGLCVDIDGVDCLETICADAPGILRWIDHAPEPNGLMRQGWIIGCLQRGPLRLPVTMPHDGWVLAAAPDGTRAGHGTPLYRILRATQGVAA